LSGVRKDASQIGSIVGGGVISPTTSNTSARNARAGFNQNNTANGGPNGSPRVGNVTYVQNNNSPKALSEAEIYRQTNNQLSKTKGALP